MYRIFRTIFFAIGSTSLALAQLANTTSLVGTVTDSSGASAAGVSITAVNTSTNDTYKTITNGSGDYNIEFIKIGPYKVTDNRLGLKLW